MTHAQGSVSADDVLQTTKRINPLQLQKILFEALEIGFMMHNVQGQNFGVARLTEIFDHLIPSAFVYGTSYWLFYTSNTLPTPICVCSKYDIPCRHKDDSRFPRESIRDSIFFLPRVIGMMYPKNLIFHSAPTAEYVDILMAFTVASKTLKHQLTHCDVQIISRYYFVESHGAADDRTLIFEPNPVIHPFYGRLIRGRLLNLYKYYRKKLIVPMSLTSPFTITRVHSYVCLAPSPTYDIETPMIYNASYSPLTGIDYDLIIDLCNNLISTASVPSAKESVISFKNRSIIENKYRKSV